MPAPRDAQALFLESLPHIERVLAALARRYGLRGDEADDLASWAKMRLIEHDYAMIAKFRGESSPSTYLAVVLAMLGREYLVREHGRWRPSAAARREGALAVRLETLVHRDHLTLAQAGEMLRTRGETALGDRELAALLGRLPRRGELRPAVAGEEALAAAPAASRADEIVDAEQAELERAEARAALAGAIDALSGEERVIVRLRFWETLSVADIARALGVPQKPLYRRLERALGALRGELERRGISRERARALSEDGAVGLPVGVSIHERDDRRVTR